MGFLWSLNDSKSPQVPTSFLSILVSILSLISNSSSLISQTFWDRLKYTYYNCYHPPMINFFSGSNIFPSFLFFLFLLCGLEHQNPLD